MAKYLSKPCVDIRIYSVSISRKFTAQPEADGDWQTCAVVQGEAIDDDGKTLASINKKFDVGSPGTEGWDADSFKADLAAVATMIKAKYNAVLASYTTP